MTATLAKLSFPQTIDVSNGPVTVRFSVELDLDAGAPVQDVILNFDYFTTSWGFASSGKLVDALDDATPATAAFEMTFDGGTPAGVYELSSVGIVAANGQDYTDYDPGALQILGAPVRYTIVNNKAPAAPTAALQGDFHGVYGTNQATLSGTATPGSEVKVTGYVISHVDPQHDGMATLGTARADASGKWTLTTAALDDGGYLFVTATTTAQGNTSARSEELDFSIATAAPDAPRIATHLDAAGRTSSATPFVSGFTNAYGKVDIYDGGTFVAATVADGDGWFGARTAPLAAGAHHLVAIAHNPAGRASAPGNVVDVTVGEAPPGIHFRIADFKNDTDVAITQDEVQSLLNDTGVILSGLIDGSEALALHVTVVRDLREETGFYAGTVPVAPTFDPASGMPLVAGAQLYLSYQFAQAIANQPEATRNHITTLSHEMLHALGIASRVDLATHVHPDDDTAFGRLTGFVGDTACFTGFYASALNGGKVALADAAHVANVDDVMYTDIPYVYQSFGFFGAYNDSAPLSAVDLGMLKDLGYANKDVLVSEDGHTFVAGDGQPGRDRVVGTSGIDTLAVNTKASAFTLHATATGFDLVDTVHHVTQHLADIERIRFADGTLAFDTGASQPGGEAYRLYQAAFGRTPDAGGLGYWIDRIDHGASLETVAGAFLGSAEFAALYGASPTDRQFVDQLYANVLHRAPDTAGEHYWTDALHDGLGRTAALVGFSESAENVAAVGAAIANGFVFNPYTA